ncbi:SAP domain protein [Jeotgalicoccus saudimassiliensis]|uniref:SAP domain protein n=1 Tax=Jeotgalicoccus saudimassiliensis TaxID=1461582 RepID=A0A078M8B0_9STAP|nr:SAP domain-containing protein [Jeotgalicoccus saudimassiliensis]CEA02505.1 SAP domain protein [Jeotgalicoccus saudimassiliensis]
MTMDAVEVLFLHYVNGKTEQEVLQHDFWSAEYNRSPKQLLNFLIESGAVYKSCDLSVTLTKHTIPVLKDLLKKSGIKVSGTKPAIIERIKAHQEFIDLSALELNGVYVADESLDTFLHDTVFINYISLHGPVTIYEAYDFYIKHPDMSNSDIIIALHENKISASLSKSNKYDAVKCHHLLSVYYDSELNDIHKSLYHLNQFTMLIILQSIERYQKETVSPPHDLFFNIDNFTVEKYRNLLLMKQFTINELYELLLEETADLPYSHSHITLASQFIIRYIIGSEYASVKLADALNNT